MYYTVYKVTNKINDKYYIGVHKTKNINDSYFGSGKLINLAISKYKKHNFKKEILFVFNSHDEAYNKEKELVTENEVLNPKCYNLTIGGKGSKGNRNSITNHSIITNDGKWIPKNEWDSNIHKGINHNKIIVKDKRGNIFAVNKENPKYISGELVPWNKNIPKTEEFKSKISKKLKGSTIKKKTWIYCKYCSKDVYKNRWHAHINSKKHNNNKLKNKSVK